MKITNIYYNSSSSIAASALEILDHDINMEINATGAKEKLSSTNTKENQEKDNESDTDGQGRMSSNN